MQLFFSVLVFMWFCIFGFMFFIIFPTSPTFDIPKETSPKEETDEKPVLMASHETSPPIAVASPEEIPKEKYSDLEKRLIQIIIKMNLSACKKCSREDKKIILQIKMMQALLDGKPKLALKYSKDISSLED